MISKTSTILVLASCLLTAYVQSKRLVTENEKDMIKETVQNFINTNWQEDLVNLRKEIMAKHPEYLNILQKLHLDGDSSSLSFSDMMHFAGYFNALAKGKLCFIKLDLQKMNIDFKAQDFKNIGAVIIANLKRKIPNMSAERAAAWDALVVKLVDSYSNLGDCSNVDDDFDDEDFEVK